MADGYEFNGWDPMADDYYDSSVNSYDTGAGAKMPQHLQPANFRKNYDNTFKLYAFPLTPRVDLEVLKNVFSKFGEVFDIYIDTKKHRWAFVYMKSQAAANKAISVINQNQELQFTVTYAKEKMKDSDPRHDGTPSRKSLVHESAAKPKDYSNNLNTSVQQFFDNAPPSKRSNVPRYAYKKSPSSLSSNSLSSDVFPCNAFPTKTIDSVDSKKPTLTKKSDSLTSAGLLQLPVCHHCNRCTTSVCVKCKEPYCSIDCSLRAFNKHRGQCVQVAPVACMTTSSYEENLKSSTECLSSTNRYATHNDEDPEALLNNFQKTATEYRETLLRASGVPRKISNSYDDEVTSVANGDLLNERNERTGDYENDVRHFSSENDWSRTVAEDKICHGRKEKQKNEFDSGLLKKSSKDRVAKNDILSNRGTELRRAHDSSKQSKNGPRSNERNSSDCEASQSKQISNKKRPVFERLKQHTTMKTSNEDVYGTATTRKENEEPDSFIYFSEPKKSVREHKSHRTEKESVTSSDDGLSSTSNRSPRGKNIDSQKSEDNFLAKKRSPIESRSSSAQNNVIIVPHSMCSNSRVSTEKVASTPEKPNYMMEDKRTKFRENVPIKIKVNEIGPTTVRIVEDIVLFNDMMADLEVEKTNIIHSPRIAEKCLARRNSCWYRACVTEVEPLEVRFVDISAKKYPYNDDLRELPDKYKNVKPFVYAVKFTNATERELFALKEKTKQPDAYVEVLPIHVERVFNLELPLAVKNELARELNEDENASDTEKFVGSVNEDLTFRLEKNVPANVAVTYIRDAVSFYVSDSDKINKLMGMMSKLDITKLLDVDDIIINRLYIAPFENDLYRARVTQVEPLTVNFIDFGNSESVEKGDLKKLPTQFYHIPPMVILVKLQEGTVESNKIELYDTLTIIPVVEDIKDAVWIVRPSKASTPTSPQVVATEPTENSEDCSSSTILDVQVMYTLSNREYYVLERKHIDTLAKMAETVDAESSLQRIKTPKVGSLCIMSFDGLWSRAKIVSLSPLTIFFIDFGNEEVVQLEELYQLPEDLEAIPTLAFKINYCGTPALKDNEFYKIRAKSDGTWELISDDTLLNPALSKSSSKSGSSDLKNTDNMRVRVMVATEENYGVILVEKVSLFKEMQKRLKDAAPTLKMMKNYETNDICVTVDECLTCYRVEILGINDDMVRVLYIDIGLEDFVRPCNLRSIPDDLLDIEPLAWRIVVDDKETQLQESEEVDVEILVQILEKYYFVRVHFDEEDNDDNCRESPMPTSETNENLAENDEYVAKLSSNGLVETDDYLKTDNKSTEKITFSTFGAEFVSRVPEMPKIDSVIQSLSSCSTGMLLILKRFSNKAYSGMLIPPKSEQEIMMKEISALKFDPDYRPQIGEFVVSYCSERGSNVRGFVVYEPTNLNPKYTVRAIDGGYFMACDQFAPLTCKFKTIPSCAVVCNVNAFPDGKKNLKVKTYQYQIKMKDSENGLVKAELWRKGKIGRYQVTLKVWSPTIDEVGIQQITISNEARVKMTSLNASNRCCITLTDEDTVDKRVEIMDEVMAHSMKANLLSEPPLVNDIVAVYFKESFYRGQILQEEENENFLVRLLDRGDEINVHWKNMKSLSETLKLPYSTAVQVVLKDLKITEVNFRMENYISDLITRDKHFQIVIDHSSKVILKFVEEDDYDEDNQRTTLNEYLNILLLPSWKMHNFNLGRMPVFFVTHMKWEQLEVGATMKLRLVHKFNSSSFSMINTRGKCFKMLNEINLSENLEDYATTIKSSYVPKKNELCIVKYDNHWHRALCINSIPTEKIHVQLIDDGRSVFVWHTDTRQMLHEFLNYIAIGFICNLKEPEKYDQNEIDKLIGTEVRGCKILERVDIGEYNIEIESLL